MALKEHGVEKFGRLIDQDIDHAHRLSALIEAEPDLELVAPTNINIVCFRYRPSGLDSAALKELNTEIMLRLQEGGPRRRVRHDRARPSLPARGNQQSSVARGGSRVARSRDFCLGRAIAMH